MNTTRAVVGIGLVMSSSCAEVGPSVRSKDLEAPALQSAAMAPPPAAPQHVTESDHFGHTLRDPYAWMEDGLASSELKAWLVQQDGYARTVLASLPGREQMQRRMRELSEDVHDVPEAHLINGLTFFLDRAIGKEKPTLQVRDARGANRVLVDIESSSATSIDFIAPSPRGRYVAYGLSVGGTEDSVLHVIEVGSGRPAMRPLERCRFAAVAWLADESGFYFVREAERRPNAPRSEFYTDFDVYLRRLDRPGEDIAVFGKKGAGSELAREKTFPRVLTDPDSRHVIITSNHAVDDPMTVLVDVGRETARHWMPIAGPEALVMRAAFRRDAVYVLTSRDAPRHRIERWRLSPDGQASRSTFFESPDAVLKGLAAARDGLYVAAIQRGAARLFYIPYEDPTHPKPVPLPYAGAISGLDAAPNSDEALFHFEGWTQAPRWLVVRGGQPTDTRLESEKDFVDAEVSVVEVRSHDGVLVPMTLLHRRGLAKDGRNPTILSAYGSYGIPLGPYFRPWRQAWLEQGGVFAFAHVRGGGEMGEPWHRAGQKLNKTNSILDLIAAAEELQKLGIATPRTLALFGESAGGVVINGAIARRPDLFAAGSVNVGYANMVNLEHGEGGIQNAEEFGSASTPEGFEGLLAMDAYHQLKDGVAYPAMLYTTGMNDPRVSPWHTLKMAARLQAATSSGQPVLLSVGFNAGHGVGAMKYEDADRLANMCSFLLWRMGFEEGAS